jgi:uncharacterized membrane protein YkvA (DUF1232 family)
MRHTSVFKAWKRKAKALKKEVSAISFAVKDPRVPWYAKAFAVLIIGYILSPIDPIPDFIPVIGYFDELIIVPIAIIILSKMIPNEVLEECREKARTRRGRMKGRHWIAASVIILIWLIVVYLSARIVYYIFLKGKTP